LLCPQVKPPFRRSVSRQCCCRSVHSCAGQPACSITHTAGLRTGPCTQQFPCRGIPLARQPTNTMVSFIRTPMEPTWHTYCDCNCICHLCGVCDCTRGWVGAGGLQSFSPNPHTLYADVCHNANPLLLWLSPHTHSKWLCLSPHMQAVRLFVLCTSVTPTPRVPHLRPHSGVCVRHHIPAFDPM
jgi:hypothetical protein